jgi:hypothetical protein
MRLVEVEGWITPQELTLADDLVRVIELARWTDHDRRLAIADLNGWEETTHRQRIERQFMEELARFRAAHQERIRRLRRAHRCLVLSERG